MPGTVLGSEAIMDREEDTFSAPWSSQKRGRKRYDLNNHMYIFFNSD